MQADESGMLPLSLGVIAGEAALASDGNSEGLFLYVEIGEGWISADIFKDIGRALRHYLPTPRLTDLITTIWLTLEKDKRWSAMEIAIRDGAFDTRFDYADRESADDPDGDRRREAIHRRYGDKPVLYAPLSGDRDPDFSGESFNMRFSNEPADEEEPAPEDARRQRRLNQIVEECLCFVDDRDGLYIHAEVDRHAIHGAVFRDTGPVVERHGPSPYLLNLLRALWEEELETRPWTVMQCELVDEEPRAAFTLPREIDPAVSAADRCKLAEKMRYGDRTVVDQPIPK